MKGSSLPHGWRWVSIDEVKSPEPRAIVSGPFGSNIGSRFFVEEGVPIIRGSNLTTDLRRFVDEGFVFLTEEKAKEFKNCEAVPGDLVFTAAGTLGQVGIVPANSKYSKYIISNKQLRARLNPAEIDNLFAFYCLSSPTMVAHIQQRNTGSTVPLINLSVLRSLEIPLPPLPEQKAIARILGSLDDKIELNRRMNATLESLAQTLFRAWFVDFEPVKAKAAGIVPVGLDAKTAALFPREFEPSTLGFVPKGWSVTKLGLVADVNWGDTKTTKSAYVPSGYVAYSASGPDGFLSSYDFDKDGVVVSAIGAGSGTTWLAQGRWSCIKNTIRFWPTNQEFSTEYLFQATHGVEKWPLRGSAQPFIAQSDARTLPILFPSNELAKLYGDRVRPLFKRITQNELESQTLAAIRDSLLPRLISGLLRVPDAESFTMQMNE